METTEWMKTTGIWDAMHGFTKTESRKGMQLFLGAKDRTQFYCSQTFQAPLRCATTISGYPAKKCVFPGFQGTYRTFGPHPQTTSGPKNLSLSSFSCLILAYNWKLFAYNLREQLSELGSYTLSWAAAEGGAKRIAWIWGGGNVLQSVLSKTTFRGLRNWGWSGRCLFLLREMTESRQKKGGKTYRRWGVQKRFWGGFSPNLRYVFHPLSFPPPLAALWLRATPKRWRLKVPGSRPTTTK